MDWLNQIESNNPQPSPSPAIQVEGENFNFEDFEDAPDEDIQPQVPKISNPFEIDDDDKAVEPVFSIMDFFDFDSASQVHQQQTVKPVMAPIPELQQEESFDRQSASKNAQDSMSNPQNFFKIQQPQSQASSSEPQLGAFERNSQEPGRQSVMKMQSFEERLEKANQLFQFDNFGFDQQPSSKNNIEGPSPEQIPPFKQNNPIQQFEGFFDPPPQQQQERVPEDNPFPEFLIPAQDQQPIQSNMFQIPFADQQASVQDDPFKIQDQQAAPEESPFPPHQDNVFQFAADMDNNSEIQFKQNEFFNFELNSQRPGVQVWDQQESPAIFAAESDQKSNRIIDQPPIQQTSEQTGQNQSTHFQPPENPLDWAMSEPTDRAVQQPQFIQQWPPSDGFNFNPISFPDLGNLQNEFPFVPDPYPNLKDPNEVPFEIKNGENPYPSIQDPFRNPVEEWKDQNEIWQQDDWQPDDNPPPQQQQEIFQPNYLNAAKPDQFELKPPIQLPQEPKDQSSVWVDQFAQDWMHPKQPEQPAVQSKPKLDEPSIKQQQKEFQKIELDIQSQFPPQAQSQPQSQHTPMASNFQSMQQSEDFFDTRRVQDKKSLGRPSNQFDGTIDDFQSVYGPPTSNSREPNIFRPDSNILVGQNQGIQQLTELTKSTLELILQKVDGIEQKFALQAQSVENQINNQRSSTLESVQKRIEEQNAFINSVNMKLESILLDTTSKMEALEKKVDGSNRLFDSFGEQISQSFGLTNQRIERIEGGVVQASQYIATIDTKFDETLKQTHAFIGNVTDKIQDTSSQLGRLDAIINDNIRQTQSQINQIETKLELNTQQLSLYDQRVSQTFDDNIRIQKEEADVLFHKVNNIEAKVEESNLQLYSMNEKYEQIISQKLSGLFTSEHQQSNRQPVIPASPFHMDLDQIEILNSEQKSYPSFSSPAAPNPYSQYSRYQKPAQPSVRKTKTNGVYIQRHIQNPEFYGSFKRMCQSDSSTLVDTYEIFITCKYETITNDRGQNIVKLVVSYKNKSHMQMNNVVVVVNNLKAHDNFYVNPLKISRPSLAPGESTRQEFVYNQFDPEYQTVTCVIGYMFNYVRRSMTLLLARPLTKFIEPEFFGVEDLQREFTQIQDQLIQSDWFKLCTRELDDVISLLPWMIRLDEYSIGGKISFSVKGENIQMIIKVIQDQECFIQASLLEKEDIRLTEQILSYFTFLLSV